MYAMDTLRSLDPMDSGVPFWDIRFRILRVLDRVVSLRSNSEPAEVEAS